MFSSAKIGISNGKRSPSKTNMLSKSLSPSRRNKPAGPKQTIYGSVRDALKKFTRTTRTTSRITPGGSKRCCTKKRKTYKKK
jgi:hypothetical protein